MPLMIRIRSVGSGSLDPDSELRSRPQFDVCIVSHDKSALCNSGPQITAINLLQVWSI